jgi:hypothetical protein
MLMLIMLITVLDSCNETWHYSWQIPSWELVESKPVWWSSPYYTFTRWVPMRCNETIIMYARVIFRWYYYDYLNLKHSIHICGGPVETIDVFIH